MGRDVPTCRTWKLPKGHERLRSVISAAVGAGYRSFDCAELYNNQKALGHAFQELLSSGVIHSREQLFLTSKLWNTNHRPALVLEACSRTLKELQVEWLDLYLLHWPVAFLPEARPPYRRGPFVRAELLDNETSLQDTWRAMEELVAKGMVKGIGVSNFTQNNLKQLLSFARIPPLVDQIEMHPYLLQPQLLDYCAANNIKVVAYSPLAQGTKRGGSGGLLQEPTVGEVAERHNKSGAQVVLRWAIQHGVAVIPKSEREEHLRQNIALFDFELNQNDMSLLDSLHCGKRTIKAWLPHHRWD
ncbi:Aldose reductase [Balamuthia mandrillaris]